jgi:chorismate synthase
MAIRFLTAGDSHGPTLTGIVEGVPAGVRISIPAIQRALGRRRRSYGRSSRQMIEKDVVEVTSGLWKGRTTGAPLAIVIPNRGRVVQGRKGGAMGTVPRPGHADFAGVSKYDHAEIPPVSERASARSTAMRVAIGAVAAMALDPFGIECTGHVTSIGEVDAEPGEDAASVRRRSRRSGVYCADAAASRRMVEAIRDARTTGDSLGGCVEVLVSGLFPGLGSHVEWDRKLDARLAAAMMSIQSVKAVSIGDGAESHRARGVDAHDAMSVRGGRVTRPSNRAGGIEGGMSNGEDIVVRLCAKPIPTARRRAASFDLRTLRDRESPYVRSDICVIPALSVIAEAVAAWEMLDAVLEKFGGDHIDDTLAAHRHYTRRLSRQLSGKR